MLLVSSGRMIDKWWIEKDLEGNSYGLIKVLYLCLSGGNETNHKHASHSMADDLAEI